MRVYQALEFLTVFIVSLIGTHYGMDLNSVYEFQLEEKILRSAIFKEIPNLNKIHCAAACHRNQECVGFGIKKRLCSLYDELMTEQVCVLQECLDDPGAVIYMKKIALTTTTTEVPTTTTTTMKPTTTTTMKPTTTTTTEKPTTTTLKPTTTTTTEIPTTTTTTKMPTTTTEKATTSTTELPTTTTTTEQPTTTTTSTTEEPTTTTTTEKPTTTTTEHPTTTTTKLPTTTTTEMPTTTTTEKPTTTTTEMPTTTTTEKPTTTTTEEPTTTTTPSPTTTTTEETTTTTTPSPTTTTLPTTTEGIKLTVIIKCADDNRRLFLGIAQKKVFFFQDDDVETICYSTGVEILTENSEKSFTYGPGDKGECTGFMRPMISGITVNLENNELKDFTITCLEIEDGNIDTQKSQEPVSSTPENKKVVCAELEVVSAVEIKDADDGLKEVIFTCQPLKDPKKADGNPNVGG